MDEKNHDGQLKHSSTTNSLVEISAGAASEEVLSKEEVERQEVEHRAYMRKLIEETFRDSVLYQIYERKGRLHEIFTDKILSMKEDAEYRTKDLQDICETERYNINNKRPEFIEYLDPLYYSRNNRYSKYDWKAVVKFKMIDGLTGQNGDYTLKELKILLYGNKDDEEQVPAMDMMHQFAYQQKAVFEDFALRMQAEFGEKIAHIEKLLEEERQGRLLLEDSSNKLAETNQELLSANEKLLQTNNELVKTNEELMRSKDVLAKIKEECKDLISKIDNPYSTIDEKEEYLRSFSSLLDKYQEQDDIILTYQNLAEKKYALIKESRKKEVREKVASCFSKVLDDSLAKDVRANAFNELESLYLSNPEIQAELQFEFLNAKNTIRNMHREEPPKKKKKFFGLFG
jgi:hypothetical protein